jgi:hypothetical protein
MKSDLLFSNAEWNYNKEREKSKYLDNISVLQISIFIFDKFVDGAQPEVASEVAGRRQILKTLVTESIDSVFTDWHVVHIHYMCTIPWNQICK